MSDVIVEVVDNSPLVLVETAGYIAQVGIVLTKTPTAGVLALDASAIPRGAIIKVPVTEDTTITVTGGYEGLSFLLQLDQDGVGGHAVTLSTGFGFTKYVTTAENLSVSSADTFWIYSLVNNNSIFYVMASNGTLT